MRDDFEALLPSPHFIARWSLLPDDTKASLKSAAAAFGFDPNEYEDMAIKAEAANQLASGLRCLQCELGQAHSHPIPPLVGD